MLSKNVTFIAGGVGLALLGYCVYFDRKRRSHPDFRKNLIERRKRAQQEKIAKETSNFPDLTDEVAVQKFFMTEISLGEQLLGVGDIENGIEHLANAVAVTSHKENLLNVLRTTLPDPIFSLLVQKLPEVSRKIYNLHKQKTGCNGSPGISELREITNEERIIEITEQNIAVDDLLD